MFSFARCRLAQQATLAARIALLKGHSSVGVRFFSSIVNLYSSNKTSTQYAEESSHGLSEVLKTIKDNSKSDMVNKKLFAVVHIGGKQFKISNNDIIMTNNKIDAECGDVIRLEKVLAVGGRTFTMLGQPLLKRELVTVQATVMEKSRGEKKVAFKKKRRKSYKRWKGHRQDLSVLKINMIDLNSPAV